jgi:hypothetical protein
MPAGGGGKTAITTNSGSSIGTEIVRVMLDDATAASKSTVLEALDLIRQRIVEANWPLA